MQSKSARFTAIAAALAFSIRLASAADVTNAAPAAGSPPAQPAASEDSGKSVTCGGATFHLGMTHAEALAQVSGSKDTRWFVRDLDSAPTPELLKMDTWNLAHSRTTGSAPETGAISLVFENGRLIRMTRE